MSMTQETSTLPSGPPRGMEPSGQNGSNEETLTTATLMNNEEPLKNARSRGPADVYALVVAAILVGFSAVVGGVVARVLIRSIETAPAAVEVLAWVGGFVAVLTACGLLLGLATVVRRLVLLATQVDQLAQHTAIRAEQEAAREPEPAIDPRQLDLLQETLGEIKELLVLPEEQRERRFRVLAEREIGARLENARALAACRDFHRARRQLALLSERFGPDPRIEQARTDVEEATRQAQEADVETARDEIKHLVHLNQWDRAEHLARELADKYPETNEPMRLIEYVCRERQLFEQRHRLRMHEEIQKHVHQRRWQDAAEAARRFIATFPVGVDTDALRGQLETLEANAEIQTRQQLEGEIKQHLQRKEYWDALAIARRIIADYPFSPQANALRNRLPALEEMARRNPK